MLHLQRRVNHQRVTHTAQPVAEFHVFQDRQELFAESPALPEDVRGNRQRVGGKVIGSLRVFGLAVMDEG